MSFEGPDVDNYGGDEDGHRKRDTSRKRDGKKDKKEKGYTMFEEEDSDGENLVLADDLKSPSKAKGGKAKPFKFPVRKEKAKEKEDKKDKEAKKEEKEKRREEKEGKKLKKEKKKSKLTLHEPAVTIAAPGDYDNPIFGVPLAVAVDRNKSHDGIELPAIVRECVDYIEECGLACEGIYRISGVKSKVQALKDSYNRHQPIYLYEHEPNIVASLLKQFLRDLPEPVLTTALMPKFEDASTAKSNKRKVELFSKVILDLPVCNRLLLSWMIVHMSHVIDLAKENKMTLQNVSIVLSPTMRISHRVLNVLFSNSQALFGDVQLRKYVPPLRPAHSKWSLELPDNLSSLEEELAKQESLLNQLHTDLNSGLTDPVIEEQLWEVQRVVTQLKRKIKLAKKGTEKNETTKTTTDPKRSSNASLPSLSAPEELQLDLKPVPEPEPKTTVTQPASAAVTTAVVEPKPSSKAEERKEDVVTLESSKTVKFAGVPDTKTEQDSKVKEEVMDKKDDVKDEGKKVGDDASGETKKKEEKVKEVVEEKKQMKDEVKVEEEKTCEQKGDKPKPQVVETESKETKKETPKPEAVVADVKSEMKEEVKSDEKPVTSVVENKPKDDEVKEKQLKEVILKSDGETKQVQSDVKGAEMKEKGLEKNQQEPKSEERKSQEKEVEKVKEKKDTQPATQKVKSESVKQHPAPMPPFMSLTLLEPVKAEIPVRKKSESEEMMDQEIQRKSEEWRELEEELLGEKKVKKKTKKESKEVSQKEDDLPPDVSTDQLMEEEYALMLEEEELIAIADELRQKMATERSEMERLAQEIQELHYLRQDSDLEDVSSESNSSDESEDEEDLQDLLGQVIKENEDLETQNAEMCQKIHEERMICLSVKLQIRLLQQKQLEASYG